MRGVGALGRQTPEWVLLGTLVASASFVLLANELGNAWSAAGYVILSWLFLGAAAAYSARLYLSRPDELDLWTVFLAFAAVFFSAGGIFGLDPVLTSTARVGFSLQALLLLAIGLIASRVGFLLVCRRGGAGPLKVHLCARLQTTRLPVVLLATAAVWGLRAYSASQGLVVSHIGDVMTEAGTGASLVIQLGQLGRPLNLFLGALLLMDRRPFRRSVGLLLMAAELVYAVLWGRRQLFAVILTLLIVALWTGRRLRLRQLITYASIVVFALVVMWPFMFHLRTVANNAGLYQADFATRTHTLVRQVLPEALATFDLQRSFGADSPYVENVRYRSQILDLLRDVMAAHRDGVPFMGGRVFLTALIATIPRALWPGKEQLLATETWQAEELIETHFGLPIFDMASTILTHGYADGGVPGVVLYMALLGVLLGVCERSLGSARSRLLGLYVYALGVAFAVQVEADITDLFAVGRVIAVLLLVDWLAGRQIERWVTVPRRRARLGRPAWEA
jgi:hypothetical protein